MGGGGGIDSPITVAMMASPPLYAEKLEDSTHYIRAPLALTPFNLANYDRFLTKHHELDAQTLGSVNIFF